MNQTLTDTYKIDVTLGDRTETYSLSVLAKGDDQAFKDLIVLDTLQAIKRIDNGNG